MDDITFKEEIPFNAIDYLLFSTVKLKESVEYFSKHKCENAVFSQHWDSKYGYKEDNLDVLKQIDVKRLQVDTSDIDDYTAINTQHNLVFLSVRPDPVKQAIDFNNFPKLEEFRGCWSKELKNLLSRDSLKELALWKYSPASKDLSGLKTLKNLESLTIIQANIQTLSGLEELKKLRSLTVGYNKSLESFGSFANSGSQLERLEIDVCKKIDLSGIRGFNRVKTLELLNNGKYPTLKPLLDNLRSLEYLNFGETSLVESDNTYLIKHPSLKEVNFLDKRHYKHNCDQVNDALNARK